MVDSSVVLKTTSGGDDDKNLCRHLPASRLTLSVSQVAWLVTTLAGAFASLGLVWWQINSKMDSNRNEMMTEIRVIKDKVSVGVLPKAETMIHLNEVRITENQMRLIRIEALLKLRTKSGEDGNE